WGHGHSHYLMMIIGVYATLGVFLLIASRNPYAHKSLIWFTVWSSVVHGAIMGVQAVTDPAERGHLLGDVPALILVAIVLAVLTPRTGQPWPWLPHPCPLLRDRLGGRRVHSFLMSALAAKADLAEKLSPCPLSAKSGHRRFI